MSEPLTHPGNVLLEKWLKPRSLTQYRLAKQLRTETRRINEVIDGLRNISPELALRLALFFENDPRYWLDLQMRYDLAVAARKHGARIKQEVRAWTVIKAEEDAKKAAEASST